MNPTDLSPRLITLHDGRPGLRGGIHVDVREPAADSQNTEHEARGTPAPCLDFIASDETLDRYHEIIMASGWRLDHYRQNPVFQNAHQYGDVIFTLGKALLTEVRNGRLYQRIEFATDVNPMAKIAYGLYKGRFLNAVSVGFIPLKWEDAKESSSLAATKPPSEGGSSIPRRRYLEQELLEVSAVGIPANPNALALAVKSGALVKADLKHLADLLRLTLAVEPKPAADKPAHHVRGQLLRMLRELRAVLSQS
jgi:hypothetical protein